jgi:hypothetical protein
MAVQGVKMQKQIKVQVSGKFGVDGLLPGFPAGTQALWQCNVLTTLLWIGILTAPPRYRGFDLSTFWAWLRYASAISDHHLGLRLKPIWTEIDASSFSNSAPLRPAIDNLVASLVALGVPEATRLEEELGML